MLFINRIEKHKNVGFCWCAEADWELEGTEHVKRITEAGKISEESDKNVKSFALVSTILYQFFESVNYE